ncbi:MAG: wax ester/triacylglycerol synthase family O-acyltransferase [Comamonadaceae bacterium]|nr:wax ester/triacylglycerol synthase family O-acyltransferase [Comamonadaceae bacterium]
MARARLAGRRSDVAALALMPDDSPTRAEGPAGSGRKVVAWSEPLPLDEVKAVGKALGCSVNDVLLACVGRRHRRLPARAAATTRAARRSARWCRSTCARSEKAWQLGNRFGLAPLVLPIGIANPIERVLRGAPRAWTSSRAATSRCWPSRMLGDAGLLVKPVQDAVLGPVRARRPPR